jgi:hypothetical protein
VTDSTSTPRPGRRTLVKGAAWSVPAVAIASQAPAFAASPCLEAAFSGTSCKEPGQPRDFTYRLSVCFTNNCAADLTVNVLRYVSNSGVTLDPQVLETIVVPQGETVCTNLNTFTSSNSANFIDVFFTLDGGAEQFIRLPSPPDCAPEPAGTDEAETAVTDEAETTSAPGDE